MLGLRKHHLQRQCFWHIAYSEPGDREASEAASDAKSVLDLPPTSLLASPKHRKKPFLKFPYLTAGSSSRRNAIVISLLPTISSNREIHSQERRLELPPHPRSTGTLPNAIVWAQGHLSLLNRLYSFFKKKLPIAHLPLSC